MKDKKWLGAVGSLVNCVICGCEENLQVAHRNEGKGMGIKAPDCLTARLCMSCHSEIDSGKMLSKADRRAIMDSAICRTLEALVRSGKVAAI